MTRVTMADVARAAGVSKQTVSRVINGKRGEASADTVRRVLEVVEQLGYRPNAIARSLATRRTRTLGLVLPNLSNPYQAEIAEGAESTAAELGYNLFMSNAFRNAENEQRALEAFEQNGVDGVIVSKPRLPDERLRRLLRRHAAAVVIERSVPNRIAGQISVDYGLSMRLAVQHLKATGRSAIGMLPGRVRSESGRTLLQAFRDALDAEGLPFDENRLQRGETTVEASTTTAEELLSRRTEIDGLVCFNDVVAMGALQACVGLGRRVPADLAVIGHGDIAFARLVNPPLTTLHLNRFEIGSNAVRMVVDRLHGRNLTISLVVRPELVVRESAPATTAGRGEEKAQPGRAAGAHA